MSLNRVLLTLLTLCTRTHKVPGLKPAPVLRKQRYTGLCGLQNFVIFHDRSHPDSVSAWVLLTVLRQCGCRGELVEVSLGFCSTLTCKLEVCGKSSLYLPTRSMGKNCFRNVDVKYSICLQLRLAVSLCIYSENRCFRRGSSGHFRLLSSWLCKIKLRHQTEAATVMFHVRSPIESNKLFVMRSGWFLLPSTYEY